MFCGPLVLSHTVNADESLNLMMRRSSEKTVALAPVTPIDFAYRNACITDTAQPITIAARAVVHFAGRLVRTVPSNTT